MGLETSLIPYTVSNMKQQERRLSFRYLELPTRGATCTLHSYIWRGLCAVGD